MADRGPPPRKKQRRPLPATRPPPEPEPALAPEFEIGTREVVAVEHPAIIQNLDNGIKTFGDNQPFERIINCTDPEECIPLYLRFRDPTCPPILSQSTSTQNIVLKITVPKRTGRRRKKGSQDPFTSDGGPLPPRPSSSVPVPPPLKPPSSIPPGLPIVGDGVAGQSFPGGPGLPTATDDIADWSALDAHLHHRPIPSPGEEDAPWEDDEPREPELCSHSRMDTSLWRRLQDNIGKYTCEAVAEIKQTHRFRGLADFHQSTTHMPFFSKFRDTALTGDIEKMRQFKFDTSRGPKPNEEIIMPTNITPYSLPFNWSWQQNPHISQETDPVTGKPILVNTSRLERLQVVYLPHYMENIPEGPSQEPPDDQDVLQIIENIKELYNARPIWTRRAIINKVNYAVTEATLHLIRVALPYIGYRFRDGPFKDAIIQFGLDPRKDPKYRMYQTIYFQLADREVRDPNAPWTGSFKSAKTPKQARRSNDKLSHFFDGRDVAVDGKIWQMCDVTDPLLAKLIKEAPISETFDAKNDGWFCNGTLAKIRAIMKVKMIALHTGRVVKDEDFKKALEMPDIIPDREGGRVWIPVPDMRLSKEEMEKLRASGKDFTTMSGMLKQKRAYNGPLRLRRHLEDEAGPSNSRQKPISTGKIDETRGPSTAETMDPRLLADQFSEARIADDTDVGMGDYGGGYNDDEDEMEDSEADRSSDLGDDDSEMEAFGRPPEDEHDTREEGRGASEADSVDMVEYHDSPSQLAQSIEGQE